MMKFINWLNVLYNLVMALFVGVAVQAATAGYFDAVTVATGIFLLGITYSLYTRYGRRNLKGLLFEGLQREVWSDHIEGEIFRNNNFMNHCHKVSDSEIITGSRGKGRIVHIQQSGGSGKVVKNRKILPAPISERKDSDVIYILDDYSTDVKLISFTAEKELSANYRSSVIGEEQDSLNQEVAENMIINWLKSPVYGTYGATSLPADNIKLSSGADGSNNNPLKNAARKLSTIDDLQKMRQYFLEIDRWFEGKMYALLSPQQEVEMFPANSQITATYMRGVTEEEFRNGVMYKAQGWKLMTRSSVVNLATDGTIKVPGEALLATDDAASLFWYENAVECAMGGTYPFNENGVPEYFGDTFSFITYAGGRARRSDYKGVALLKQAKV